MCNVAGGRRGPSKADRSIRKKPGQNAPDYDKNLLRVLREEKGSGGGRGGGRGEAIRGDEPMTPDTRELSVLGVGEARCWCWLSYLVAPSWHRI